MTSLKFLILLCTSLPESPSPNILISTLLSSMRLPLLALVIVYFLSAWKQIQVSDRSTTNNQKTKLIKVRSLNKGTYLTYTTCLLHFIYQLFNHLPPSPYHSVLPYKSGSLKIWQLSPHYHQQGPLFILSTVFS